MTTAPGEPSIGLFLGLWANGTALIAVAAFLFSVASLAVKLIDDVPTFQIVLLPSVVCLAATSLAVRGSGQSLQSKSWRVAGLTVLRGLLGATSITCFYLAVQMLPLQDAVTLFFCSPVIASLLEWLVLGESHGWAGATATVCTVAGVVLVSRPACLFDHAHLHPHTHHGAGSSSSSGSDAGFEDLLLTHASANVMRVHPHRLLLGSVAAGTGAGTGLAGVGQGQLEAGGGSSGWELLAAVGGGVLAAARRALLHASGEASAAAGVGEGAEAPGAMVPGVMPPDSPQQQQVLGVLLATGAAIANASAFVVVRVLRRCQHTLTLTWYYHAVVVMVTAVPLALGYPAPAVRPSPRDGLLLAVVAASQFLGQICLNRGFQLESATRGSAINVLQVLFSFLWDIVVLGDRPSLLSMGGSSLVAAGVLAVALSGPVTHTNSHDHRQQRAHPQQHYPPDGGTAGAGDGVRAETVALLCAGDDVEGGYGVLAGGDAGGVAWAGERAPVGLRRGQEEVSGSGGGGEDSPGSYYTPRSEMDGDEEEEKGDGQAQGTAAANAAHHHPQQSRLRQPLLARVAGRLSFDTIT